VNLYGMVGNNAVNWVDVLGLSESGGDDCCCCAKDIKITRYKNTSDFEFFPDTETKETGVVPGKRAGQFGHKFTVKIETEYKNSGTNGGKCQLKWEEKTNILFRRSGEFLWNPDEWYDLYADDRTRPNTPVFKSWDFNPPGVPLGGVTYLEDKPQIGQGSLLASNKSMTRTLHFRITVVSAPDCPCDNPQVSVTAKQVLTADANGLADNDNSSFQTPDPDQ
jgi:hypothetical protein